MNPRPPVLAVTNEGARLAAAVILAAVNVDVDVDAAGEADEDGDKGRWEEEGCGVRDEEDEPVRCTLGDSAGAL